MKHAKKFASLLLALVMVLSLSVTAFAQDVTTSGNGSSTITINNASKGVTYEVYKIFDATYNSTTGTIAYTYEGTLPQNDYFVQNDATGAITATEAAVGNDGALNEEAIKWVTDNLKNDATKVGSAVADGSTLKFKNLDYGYYLVTSTHGVLVAVNSTQPDAVMNDKNNKVPTWNPEDPSGGKAIVTSESTIADTTEANIGETVKFRLSIITQNFTDVDNNPNPIAHYTISDNAPAGLELVSIDSVKVDGTDVAYTATDGKFPITIEWFDKATKKSKYNANAKLEVEYTARLTDNAVIDGTTGNKNEATFTYDYYDPENPDTPTPSEQENKDSATVYTYALGFKKVSDKGVALAGAEFELPFYVKETADSEGVYTYAGTSTGEGLTNKLTTTDTGLIVIKGVKSGSYSFKETKAPDGYNKLADPFTVSAAQVGSSTTTETITKYLDENGNVTTEEKETEVTYEAGKLAITDLTVVVNKAGALLPSTGGIGTTIFYVVGAILMIGAGVMLVTRKRISK